MSGHRFALGTFADSVRVARLVIGDGVSPSRRTPGRARRSASSPAGNGVFHGSFLAPGDVLVGEITGLGRHRNSCVAEAAPGIPSHREEEIHA